MVFRHTIQNVIKCKALKYRKCWSEAINVKLSCTYFSDFKFYLLRRLDTLQYRVMGRCDTYMNITPLWLVIVWFWRMIDTILSGKSDIVAFLTLFSRNTWNINSRYLVSTYYKLDDSLVMINRCIDCATFTALTMRSIRSLDLMVVVKHPYTTSNIFIKALHIVNKKSIKIYVLQNFLWIKQILIIIRSACFLFLVCISIMVN